MTNLELIFLTGLTTGGLSCLAVQGGLLASSVAHRAEEALQHSLIAQEHNPSRVRSSLFPPTAVQGLASKQYAGIILLFLAAKLVAYTLLGFGLGWLGSVLQLTPFTQAVMQLAVGLFMVGSALRMLNVHPIFRYFVLEPPAVITRYIRRHAKQSANNLITPIFLGTMTVLIPCGVTQVMMATAVASGNPFEGAAIMLAFTLGSSPLFFALAYLATQLSRALEARFMQVVAVLVLVLGVISVNAGLNLLGSPLAIRQLMTTPLSAVPVADEPTTESSLLETLPKFAPLAGNKFQSSANVVTVSTNIVEINVLDDGYSPNIVNASADQAIQLKLVTSNTWGCTRAFVIPALNYSNLLSDTGEVVVDLPPQQAGSSLLYTCSMGMYSGVIHFN